MPTTRFSMGRVLALLALLSSSTSQAEMVVYTSAAEFDAAVESAGVDGYDGIPASGPTPSPMFRTAGPWSYVGRTSASTFYGAGSAADTWLSTNNAGDSMIFDVFPSSVSAVGANVFSTNLSGSLVAGDVLVSFSDGDSSDAHTVSGASTSAFVGIVSDNPPITMIVTATQVSAGARWPTIDNLRLARRIPADRIFRNDFD